jgi:hypothetical protein
VRTEQQITVRQADRPGSGGETPKQKTDRQLIELLNELRVALPGAQVLLAFLLAVPFATRFDKVEHRDRVALFVCLLLTAIGTILLMAPSVYHRLRWDRGGKSDVIAVGHVLLLVGTSFLGLGVLFAVYMVSDFLFGGVAGIAAAAVLAVTVLVTWYLLPLARGHSAAIRERE